MPEEMSLGGTLNDAVRIGDTVHRRAGRWTPAVHALLRYLERANFPAPRVIGMDAQGREVLRYIDGDADPGNSGPMPDHFWEDARVVEAAQLLRRYHDVVASFKPLPNAKWRVVAPTAYEIVCHNDWSPSNAVLRGGQLQVMLDWDLAGPGTRLWDVAAAVYNWTPLFPGYKHTDIADRARRVRHFLDAYGLADRAELLLVIRMRMEFMSEFVRREAAAGEPAMVRLRTDRWEAAMADGLRYLEENWSVLERAL